MGKDNCLSFGWINFDSPFCSKYQVDIDKLRCNLLSRSNSYLLLQWQCIFHIKTSIASLVLTIKISNLVHRYGYCNYYNTIIICYVGNNLPNNLNLNKKINNFILFHSKCYQKLYAYVLMVLFEFHRILILPQFSLLVIFLMIEI